MRGRIAQWARRLLPFGKPPLHQALFWLGLLLLALLMILWAWKEPWNSKAWLRAGAGKQLRVHEYVELGFWFGTAVNVVLCGILMGTARFWTRAVPGAGAAAPAAPVRPGWFLPCVLVVATLAMGIRAPLLDDALRRDEQDTLSRDIWGYYERQPDHSLKFIGRGWEDTLWENGGANNPVLFSILSRLSLSAWQGLSGAGNDVFNRTALRLPSYLGGAAGVLVVGLLLAELGLFRAGLAASILLCVHPWHMRYSAEARGYSLAVFFALLAMWFLLRALRLGRWRDWGWFAGAQFCMLYSFPGGLYLAGAQTALAMVLLPWKSGVPGEASTQAGRIIVVNVIAAMLFIQMMAPCVPQILDYLKTPTTFGAMGVNWAYELVGQLAAGISLGDYYGSPPQEFGRVYDLSQLRTFPGMFGFAVVAVPALWGLGFLRLVLRDKRARLLALAVTIGPLLAFAHNKATGHYLYPWYLIYLLPFVLAFLAVAADWPSALRVAGRRGAPVAGVAALALVLAVFVAFTNDSRAALHRPRGWPYVDFQRGPSLFRAYPEGTVIRITPGKP